MMFSRGLEIWDLFDRIRDEYPDDRWLLFFCLGIVDKKTRAAIKRDGEKNPAPFARRPFWDDADIWGDPGLINVDFEADGSVCYAWVDRFARELGARAEELGWCEEWLERHHK